MITSASGIIKFSAKTHEKSVEASKRKSDCLPLSLFIRGELVVLGSVLRKLNKNSTKNSGHRENGGTFGMVP